MFSSFLKMFWHEDLPPDKVKRSEAKLNHLVVEIQGDDSASDFSPLVTDIVRTACRNAHVDFCEKPSSPETIAKTQSADPRCVVFVVCSANRVNAQAWIPVLSRLAKYVGDEGRVVLAVLSHSESDVHAQDISDALFEKSLGTKDSIPEDLQSRIGVNTYLRDLNSFNDPKLKMHEREKFQKDLETIFTSMTKKFQFTRR